MKVAIYSRIIDEEEQQEMQRLLDELKGKKILSTIHHSFYEKIQSTIQFPPGTSVFHKSEDLDETIDFVISLGGDGTLLDTVSLVRDKNIPILGINFGRLGFLASIGKEDLATA